MKYGLKDKMLNLSAKIYYQGETESFIIIFGIILYIIFS